MKRVIVLSLGLLPLVTGCSIFQADPVPPSPALVGVSGQDAAWASQIKRRPDGASFEPLVDAREAVEQARSQPQVESFDAQSLADAEQALASAEAGWQPLAEAKRRPADKLAAVADDAHRAQRLAEIARYTAVREIKLKELLALNEQIEQQQARTAPVRGGSGIARGAAGADNLIGQRVVPDRLGDIEFQTGTARLTGPSQAVVQRLAALMKNNPDYGVAVFGHTDNMGPSDASLERFVQANPGLEEQAPTREQQVRAFNLALSAARARAVAQTLVNDGVEARRIGARGFGDTRPVAANNTADGRRANRRIEAIIVPGPDSQAARQGG
ncbi:OmpA family protein [Salinisphaera sp. T31B1]|uniref:OmpA family protein n=1 Tax=Salinisphaera sp. T31B1 TaxID=727963 RepID=UPI00333E7F55